MNGETITKGKKRRAQRPPDNPPSDWQYSHKKI